LQGLQDCSALSPEGLPHQPPYTVPSYSTSRPPWDGKTNPDVDHATTMNQQERVYQLSFEPFAAADNLIEGAMAPEGFRPCHPRSSLTVSFFRPRARRRARTLRPFFVAMRARNPCVFRRFRL
jgi:hypothetical protein